MPNGENRKAIEQRVLEAEKVVVSNMLHNWRKRYGMDYVILIRNGPGNVFSRVRVSDEGAKDMMDALVEAERNF